MQATYTEPRKTLFTFEEAAAAMRAALSDVLNSRPPDAVLALALAKSALETGRWSSCWNYNWGNIKAGADYVGMYTCITLNEVIGGKVIWFSPQGQLTGGASSALVGSPVAVPPGHPQTRMRAYANHFDGAFAYVEFVSGLKRYVKSWQALLAGDAVAYVHELKVSGYFTAAEEPYRKAVVSLQKEFLLKLEGKSPERTPDEDTDWNSIRATVANLQAESARDAREQDHLDKMAELGGMSSIPPEGSRDA